MKLYSIIFMMSSVLIINSAYSQDIENISVEFIRIITEKGSREIVKGTIYYQVPSRTIVRITEPINQYMIIDEKAMYIYYPDNDKIFHLESKDPLSLPFFQFLVLISNDNWNKDLGLSKIGYTIKDKVVHGDTVFFYWKPPQNAEKKIGNFIVAIKEDQIVSTESKNAKGKTLVKITYDNYINCRSRYFPLQINSTQYSGKYSSTESVTFSNLVVDKPLPKEIVNFKLPDNIEVNEAKW